MAFPEDHSTKLQKAIDEFGDQMSETLKYLSSKHDYQPFEGQIKVTRTEKDSSEVDNPEAFEQKKRQLATNLVGQAKHIDALADSLSGLNGTAERQIERIKELEIALANVEKRRSLAIDGRRDVQNELDSIIATACLSIRAAK